MTTRTRTAWAASLLIATACGSTSAGGLAERGTVVVEEIRCYILKPVMFTKGSAALTSDALEIVTDMATSMTRDPDAFVSVEAAGHASADEDDGLELSRRRASTVRDRLIALGVEPSRIRARGYAAHCSMRETNDEEPYRDRRVETRILRSKSGDTGAEVGCPAATAAGLR